MKIRTFAAVFAALLVAAAAYAAGRTGLTRYDQPEPAPEFSLPDLQGQTHRLSDYRGQVLVVKFWATYCRPCIKEMPELQAAWEALKDEGVQVLGIDVGDTREAVLDFKQRVPVEFPLLLDQDSSVVSEYWVRGLPTTFVIDPQGRIVMKVVGEHHWNSPEMLQELRALKQG